MQDRPGIVFGFGRIAGRLTRLWFWLWCVRLRRLLYRMLLELRYQLLQHLRHHLSFYISDETIDITHIQLLLCKRFRRHAVWAR